MATLVHDLLNFPDSSKSLSTFTATITQPTIVDKTPEDRPHSPVHKRPRLETDVLRQSSNKSLVVTVTSSSNIKPSKLDINRLRSTLSKFVQDILAGDPSSIGFGTASHACRALVLQAKQGDALYRLLDQKFQSLVGQIAEHLHTEADTRPKLDWVSAFVRSCDGFITKTELLTASFSYLDQIYARVNGLDSIKDMAFKKFRNTLFHSESSKILDQVHTGVISWLDLERNTSRKSAEIRGDIAKLVQHMILHRQFEVLEARVMDHTRTFYQAEMRVIFNKIVGSEATNDVTFAGLDRILDYIDVFEHIQRRVEEEIERAADLPPLPPATVDMLKQVTEKALLTSYALDDQEGIANWLARLICTQWSSGSKTDVHSAERLRSLYNLFKRTNVKDALIIAFRCAIQGCVHTIINDKPNDDDMVDHLLAFKALTEKTINESFHVAPEQIPRTNLVGSSTMINSSQKVIFDADATRAMHAAFTAAFKTRPLVPAERIARRIDKEMRSGQGKTSQKEYTARLKAILSLYRYSDDKDVFRIFYHRALAKRLLLGRSASDDEEKKMLKFLAKEYDPEFGTCEAMFKDLALSRELNESFHKHEYSSNPMTTKLSAMVLQHSAWPFTTSNDKAVLLPREMREAVDSFEKHYKKPHENRKLHWIYSLGTATLTARFTVDTKELSVSLYQALVLLMYNSNDDLQYLEIKDALDMGDDDLVRTLQSLSLGKKRVLKKMSAGKDVRPEDIFSFNDAFTDPRAKVHINSIQAKVTQEESRRTQNTIEGDRKYLLEAAIVRIMKGKKELSFEALQMATIDAVKAHFKPEVTDVKKRIESLVEQEYLERKPDADNVFLYVA